MYIMEILTTSSPEPATDEFRPDGPIFQNWMNECTRRTQKLEIRAEGWCGDCLRKMEEGLLEGAALAEAGTEREDNEEEVVEEREGKKCKSEVGGGGVCQQCLVRMEEGRVGVQEGYWKGPGAKPVNPCKFLCNDKSK